MRPYLIGATIVSVLAFLMGIFLLPKASEGFNNFRYTYLRTGGKEIMRENSDVFRQINKDEYIYVGSFNQVSNMAFNFSMEKFDKDQLKYKITASRIKWNSLKKNYTLYDYNKRTVGELSDKIEMSEQKDTVFSFDLEDLTPTVYVAETLSILELNHFIDKEIKRGNANISVYLVVLYKKYSLPVSAFILTIIALSVSSMKRRGGMGINLAIGIAIAFAFVFFDKIFGALAEKSTINPFIAVWLPNVLFGILAIYLLRNAKR
jgi:lipopolysaccharide export system permease protein